MAEKRPKSILSGLKNMLHLDPEKPSKAATKPSAPARKKPAAEKRAVPAQPTKEQRPSPPAAEAPAAPDPAAEPAPEKSKVKNQPWYRHRQRW